MTLRQRIYGDLGFCERWFWTTLLVLSAALCAYSWATRPRLGPTVPIPPGAVVEEPLPSEPPEDFFPK